MSARLENNNKNYKNKKTVILEKHSKYLYITVSLFNV